MPPHISRNVRIDFRSGHRMGAGAAARVLQASGAGAPASVGGDMGEEGSSAGYGSGDQSKRQHRQGDLGCHLRTASRCGVRRECSSAHFRADRGRTHPRQTRTRRSPACLHRQPTSSLGMGFGQAALEQRESRRCCLGSRGQRKLAAATEGRSSGDWRIQALERASAVARNVGLCRSCPRSSHFPSVGGESCLGPLCASLGSISD